jgi:endogenous inhibitor of DNA gyrase (YacG/DUF329 family)
VLAEGAQALCVFCRRKPAVHHWRPFCSERCQTLDLARWADGTYRVPGEQVESPEEYINPESDPDSLRRK